MEIKKKKNIKMKHGESVELRKHTKKFIRFDVLFKKNFENKNFLSSLFLKICFQLKKKKKMKIDLPNAFLKMHFLV